MYISGLQTGDCKIIRFKSRKHEEFYRENLLRCRHQDVYHKALVYCLGIDSDTRDHVERIYDFTQGLVKPECLQEGWQTSGSAKIVRMAFNLYCNGMPSVSGEESKDELLDECRRYTVEDLFSSAYARYFWEAVKIRYPDECYYIDLDES